MEEMERKYEIGGEKEKRTLVSALDRKGYKTHWEGSNEYVFQEYGQHGQAVHLGIIEPSGVRVFTTDQKGKELAEFLEQLDLN